MHSLALFLSLLPILILATLTNTRAIAQEQIKLQATSDKGAFLVDITWIPNGIGRMNTFDIHFSDPETHTEIEDVKYDVSVYSDDGRQVFQRMNQVTTQQELSFPQSGSYIIRIDNIEDLGENTTIPIMVTPEFLHLGALVLAATAIGAIVFLARQNSNGLFSDQII